MKEDLLNLMKQRRTIYTLGKDVNFSEAELNQLITDVVKEAPSAFNSQTTRVVFTYGQAHEKVWDMTLAELKKVTPAEAFGNTEAKVNGAFKAGFGTMLWYTDMDKVKELEEGFPLYAENFYDWSEQHIGNAQFAAWTALAENGLGASLQHYNPLIDEAVKAEFDIPDSWRLRGEMPFGSVESTPDDKDYIDDGIRFKSFN